MKRKLNPKIFKHAAEMVAVPLCSNPQFYFVACSRLRAAARRDASHLHSDVYIQLFNHYFKPKYRKYYERWFGELNEANALTRSLALLFMAEIVKEKVDFNKLDIFE